jgi:hypothetical protein
LPLPSQPPVTKQRDPNTQQNSLLFQVDYPEISEGVQPKHRFMSAFEQKVEAPDRKWQYLMVAAEPYEVGGVLLIRLASLIRTRLLGRLSFSAVTTNTAIVNSSALRLG